MIQKSKTQYVLICLAYLFFYAAYTSFFSFLTVYLKGYGYETSQIGLLFTCMSLINLVAQPIFGYLADHKCSVKLLVAVGMCVTIPGAFLLQSAVRSFPLTIACVLLVAFFDYSMIGLMDAWTNQVKERRANIKYSVARGMGSLSSALAALIIGNVLDALGNAAMLWFHAGFMALALICLLFFENVPCAAGKASAGKGRVKSEGAFAALWNNKKYRYFILAGFLINLGWRVIPTFLPVIVLDFGGSSTHQGLAMAMMTIGIAPFMFLYPKLLKRFGVNRMLLIGAVLTVVRVFSMTLVTNLPMLIGFQLFEAVSFGLFQPSMIEYINQAVPAGSRALAVTVCTAVQMALCGTVGNYLGGIFLEHFSFRLMFLFLGVLGAAGFLLMRKSTALGKPASGGDAEKAA